MKRISAIIAAFALVVTSFTAANADAYSPDVDQLQPGSYGFDIVDTFESSGEGNSFLVSNEDREGKLPNEILCQGFGSGPCSFDRSRGYNMWSNLILPACKTAEQFNCIAGVSIYKKDEAPVAAKFVRQINGEHINADPAHNLTEGSTKSIWQGAVKHAGGTDEYTAFVQMNLGITDKNTVFAAGFTATIVPTNEVPLGTAKPTKMIQQTRPDGSSSVGGQTFGPRKCGWTDTGICAVAQDFAPDTKVGLQIRLEKTVGGWFKGRLKSPNIQISSFSSTVNLISIDAEPVSVPMFYTRVPSNTTDPDAKAFLSKSANNLMDGSTQNTRSDFSGTFDLVKALRNVAKDTADGTMTLWSVGTIPSGASGCLADTSKVLGLVTTNSMVYEGSSPRYEGGLLNYRVAGLHYNKDGSTVEGTYDLVMRSDVARCIYGFSSAPVTASISITGSGGEAKIATTNMYEKDGWLHMSAYGFTFSENSIRAKITQSGKKLVTITCVKGKTSKKVTAVAPKCPAGFKKK